MSTTIQPAGRQVALAQVRVPENVRGLDDAHAPDELDPSRPIAVICSSGRRSAVAASLLMRHGAEHVIHVADGGVGTWGARGWPTDVPEPARGRG